MQFSQGVKYMLVATMVFSVMNVCVKYLSHIPAVEIVFFRAIISLSMSITYLRFKKIPIWGNNKKILILRGVLGTVALVLLFTTFQRMPLASAVVLHYLSPLFTAILVYAFLGEKLYVAQWFFFAVCFGGTLLVKGFDPRVETIYFVYGIGAALLSGGAYTCIRLLKTSENPLVIVFYFPLIALPVTGVLSSVVWVQPVGYDWLLLLVIGVLTQIAQVFMTKAYQAEAAAKVASVTYTGIVFALIFGYFFFAETYPLLSFVGMALVIAGVFLNVTFKQSKTGQ